MVVLSSESAQVKPSAPLSRDAFVFRRKPQTGEWFIWTLDRRQVGRWRPVELDEVRSISGTPSVERVRLILPQSETGNKVDVFIEYFESRLLGGERSSALAKVEKLIVLLHEAGFAPEQFSFVDDPAEPGSRKVYTADAFHHYFLAPGSVTPVLIRNQQPSYELRLGTAGPLLPTSLLSWSISPSNHGQLEQILALASKVASLAEPLFGGAGWVWDVESDAAYNFNAMMNMRSWELKQNGPDSAAIRTWFGPAFASQLDRTELEALGMSVRRTDWGSLEVDLTEAPWKASFESLAERKASLNTYLSERGLLGDYSRAVIRTPGRNWKALLTPE